MTARPLEAREALESALGESRVWADPLALALFARDASMIEGRCSLVAFPRSRDEVLVCLRVAGECDLPVVPRGAGTGLAGGATPIGDALVVVVTRMHRILEVRPEDRLAWVEPGVLNLDLVEAVAPLGLTFAPDPSSQQSSTLGGNVGTNAGGPHCLAYGVTSNHILAVELALPNGTIVRLGGEGPEFAGYDLRALVVGSEGMLGIVTAMCVRLTPLPPAVAVLLADFSTVEDAAATVSETIAAGIVPAAMELMDAPIVRVVEEYVHAGYPTDAAAVLLIEVDGLAAGVDRASEQIRAIARSHGARGVRLASDAEERARLWKGRKSALGAVARLAPNYYLNDFVVPRARLSEALTTVQTIGRRHDLLVVNMFHAGDGNLHPIFLFDHSIEGSLERVLTATDELARYCLSIGGTLSGEHGIGLEKREFMSLMFSPVDLAAQDCLRAAFDPARRMNPGKVLPTGSRCSELPQASALAQGSPASVRTAGWI